MIIQTWASVLQQSFLNLLWGVVGFIPNLVLAIIIFVIGWVIGVFLGRVVAEVIRAIKVDHALRVAGVEEVMSRAGYSLNAGNFLGALVKWFIIAVFLIASLQVLGLTQVNLFLSQIVLGFLPQVIIAVLIILVAAVIAEVAQGFVTASARAAGLHSAGFAGTVARWAIWVFAIIVALSQLGIAAQYFQTLFMGIVIALSLAFGLAFGLGGQDAASGFLARVRESMKSHH